MLVDESSADRCGTFLAFKCAASTLNVNGASVTSLFNNNT